MRAQLEAWQGEFGAAYTQRNVVDWRARVPAFRRMFQRIKPGRVLEVGCNRGHNLVAIAEGLPGVEVVGIEPNPVALEIARQASPKASALQGNAGDLPFKDGWFDTVFTCGVLIHIPLDALGTALQEIYRVSRRYILAVEYFAKDETVIPYRGHEDLLWKRDFLAHYQSRFPDLGLIDQGFWGPGEAIDHANWWLLEKPWVR